MSSNATPQEEADVRRSDEMMVDDTGEPDRDGALRRASPELYVIDDRSRVVLSSDGASRPFESERDEIWSVVGNLLLGGPLADLATAVAGSCVVRVFPMAGSLEKRYCVLVERRRSRATLDDASARFGLTAREIDVLRLMLAGMNTSAIAGSLCIAETTVADHVKHIASKTQSRNRTQIVARVLGA